MMVKERDIEDYEKTYSKHKFEKEMIHYRIKNILEMLDKYKPKKIMEIGCGIDSVFNHYKNFERFVVVEPSEAFISKARQDAGNARNIILVNDFFENAVDDLKDRDFDFVIFSNLLHEVPDPYGFLLKIKKVLSKNTVLYINVTNSESFHKLWAYESGMIKSVNEPSESFKKLQQTSIFNMRSLIEMVNNAGFFVIEKGSYFIKPFNHEKMFLLMQDGVISEELLDGLYKMAKYFPENGAEIYLTCKIVQ